MGCKLVGPLASLLCRHSINQSTNQSTAKPKEAITITLPDGSVKEGTAWVTTPYDIAAGIAQGLADNSVVAKVRPYLFWMMDRLN